jgi:hypothetical protein
MPANHRWSPASGTSSGAECPASRVAGACDRTRDIAGIAGSARTEDPSAAVSVARPGALAFRRGVALALSREDASPCPPSSGTPGAASVGDVPFTPTSMFAPCGVGNFDLA